MCARLDDDEEKVMTSSFASSQPPSRPAVLPRQQRSTDLWHGYDLISTKSVCKATV
jgi:hypothetical protein